MGKIKDWLRQSEAHVYINDEGDEIVKEITNGEFVTGYLFVLLLFALFAICL